MRPGGAARVAVAALACAALALGGCGDEEGDDAASAGRRPAEGGTLAFALASKPNRLDPLLASDRASQLVSRQIHEPLTESLSGPFGDVRRLAGLAALSSPSGDQSIWRFRLRARVRFQDGTPFNASAVLANADRWVASPQGRALLPDLLAADAPRPDLVRFVLGRPDPAFPERLADPRLGLVSPRALGSPRRLAAGHPSPGTGTGAFELRERTADGGAVMARSAGWWGTRFDLGPALDQLVFPVVPSAAERVALLEDGEVEAADELGAAAAEVTRRNPLLTLEGPPGGPAVGLSRAVRGIGDEAVPYLSGAWLTTVGAGS